MRTVLTCRSFDPMQMQNGDAAPSDDIESSPAETDTADAQQQSRKGPRRALVPFSETADHGVETNGSSKTAIPASASLRRAGASDGREKANSSAAETSNGHTAATHDAPHKTATGDGNGVDTTADTNMAKTATVDVNAEVVSGTGARTKRGPRGAKRAAPSADDGDAPVAKRSAESGLVAAAAESVGVPDMTAAKSAGVPQVAAPDSTGPSVSEEAAPGASQSLPVAVTAPTAAATLHVQPLAPQRELAVQSVQLPASGSDYGAQPVSLSGLQVGGLAPPEIKAADTAVSIALPISNGHVSLPQAVAVNPAGHDTAAHGVPVPVTLPHASDNATSGADEPPLKRPHLLDTSAPLSDTAAGLAPAPAPSAAVTSTASFGQHALGGDYSFSDAGNGWDEAVAEQGAVLAADRKGLAHAAPLH